MTGNRWGGTPIGAGAMAGVPRMRHHPDLWAQGSTLAVESVALRGLAAEVSSPSWADHAACADSPVDFTAVSRPAERAEAARVCAGCPVFDACDRERERMRRDPLVRKMAGDVFMAGRPLGGKSRAAR